MTSVARRRIPHRRRRRPAPRRGHGGFWSGLRRETHTDHLRHRLGGATGRAMMRALNRRRARKGKAPIPARGGDWYRPGPAYGSYGKPVRPARNVRPRAPRPATAPRPPRPPRATRTPPVTRSGGTTPPAAQPQPKAQPKGGPAFAGPHVKATNTPRKAPTGGTSVTSSGIAGPGNRGAGAGMGAPAYGAGGAHGDDGHLISPGSAGGSATGGAPNTTGAPITGYDPPSRRVPSQPTQSTHTAIPTGGPMSEPSAAPPAGGGGGGTSNDLEQMLSEPPESDAEYVERMRAVADILGRLSEAVSEAEAVLNENVGIDPKATGKFDQLSEHLAEAGQAANAIVQDFMTTYEGVLQTVADGTSIPDGKGQGRNRWWTGDVS